MKEEVKRKYWLFKLAIRAERLENSISGGKNPPIPKKEAEMEIYQMISIYNGLYKPKGKFGKQIVLVSIE